MNNYTKKIVKELSQIKDFSIIQSIKEMNLNGTALPQLELDEDCLSEIWNAWDTAKIFYIEEERHICTRPYVCEVIIHYCQNRTVLRRKYNLKDEMNSQY